MPSQPPLPATPVRWAAPARLAASAGVPRLAAREAPRRARVHACHQHACRRASAPRRRAPASPACLPAAPLRPQARSVRSTCWRWPTCPPRRVAPPPPASSAWRTSGCTRPTWATLVRGCWCLLGGCAAAAAGVGHSAAAAGVAMLVLLLQRMRFCNAGFMVIRGGELVFMSPQQQHEFNFPFQACGGLAAGLEQSQSAVPNQSLPTLPSHTYAPCPPRRPRCACLPPSPLPCALDWQPRQHERHAAGGAAVQRGGAAGRHHCGGHRRPV